MIVTIIKILSLLLVPTYSCLLLYYYKLIIYDCYSLLLYIHFKNRAKICPSDTATDIVQYFTTTGDEGEIFLV